MRVVLLQISQLEYCSIKLHMTDVASIERVATDIQHIDGLIEVTLEVYYAPRHAIYDYKQPEQRCIQS